MIFENLVKMDIKELRVLAAQYNIPTHHRAKPETVAKQIIEHITAKPQSTPATDHSEDTMSKPLVRNKPDLVVYTPEEVKLAIAPYMAKEGFTAEFPGDDTWIFKCKGAEESGHMSCPLRTIKLKAQTISVGARKPRQVKIGDDVMLSA